MIDSRERLLPPALEIEETMRFSDIPGNENVKRTLRSMADSGRVPHALLLYENEGCGAFALATAFLQYLACPHRHDGDSCGECPSCNRMSKLIHSDVHFVFPTNTGSLSGSLDAKNVVSEVYAEPFRKLALANPYFTEQDLAEAIGVDSKACDINVEEARQLIGKLSLTSVEGGWKSVVCMMPEKINIQAANKLLKTIEEPPAGTVMIFITHNPDKVLQTIFSRCQSMRVNPLTRSELEQALVQKAVPAREAAVRAAVSGGSMGAAMRALSSAEGLAAFQGMFTSLMDALLSRNLEGVLDWADSLVEIGSKERQKAFLRYVSDCLRKLFLLQQGLDSIAYTDPGEEEYLTALAGRCPRSFSRRALTLLDESTLWLDRNVNQKILFCDLADRLFLTIGQK